MYCGQTVGWIKMKLGIQVVIGPGHIVLAEDPAPIPQKGAKPPIFGPYLLWLNGWMDQDATWPRGRPQPSDIVLDGNSAPHPQIGAETSPIFGPYLLWSNGSMHQDATW